MTQKDVVAWHDHRLATIREEYTKAIQAAKDKRALGLYALKSWLDEHYKGSLELEVYKEE